MTIPSVSVQTLPSQRENLRLEGDREPWERQPDEQDRDWGCFQLYRDMHPSVRSLAKAFALYLGQLHPENAPDPAGALKAPAWFENIAAHNQWHARAKEYDAWQDEDALQRLQSLKVAALVQAHQVGHTLVEKATEALQALQAVQHEMIVNEQGQLVTVSTSALSPSAIVQLVKAGVELRRYALGMEASGGQGTNVHVNIANVNTPTGRLPITADDEALLARVREIAQAEDETIVDVRPLPARLAPGK